MSANAHHAPSSSAIDALQQVREREVTAEASALRNLERINQALEPLRPELNARLSVIRSRGPGKAKKVFLLKALAARMSDVATPLAACRARCTHCCHIPVALSALEAEELGKAIGVKPMPPDQTRPVHQREYGYHAPCPFLEAGGCAIYEHRPLSCRTHINLDDDELLCRLHPGETIRVPYMDMTVLQHTYMEVVYPSPLGDIRDFFPNGLGLRKVQAGQNA